MVPDPPTPSRRQFLGGLAAGAGLGGTSLAAVGATRPTALPNVVADYATNLVSGPPAARDVWQPTVTEAHARAAVDLLAETDAAARERWAEVDAEPRFTPGAGGWLENAQSALADGDYPDALFDARYGMQFAGRSLGTARAELGEADLGALAERSEAILDRVDAVVEALRPYPVADPERDLAWYLDVESEAQRARSEARWHGFEAYRDGEVTTEVSESDPRDVGQATKSVLRAELSVETAERYLDRLSERVADGDREFESHLRDLGASLAADLESIPTQNEVSDRFEDVEEYGPYEFARIRLAWWCFPTGVSAPWRTPVDEEFLLLDVLALARGLVDWRAHDAAVEELVIPPDQEGFRSGHALAEKRRAVATYESVIGSDPAPFRAVFHERAIEDVRVADVDRHVADEGWSRWRGRVKAYCYALVGRTKLRELPPVYDRVIEAE